MAQTSRPKLTNGWGFLRVGRHRRELYLLQEPALLAAIRRGDRGEARRIINHVLVHIYSSGEERSDLLKPCQVLNRQVTRQPPSAVFFMVVSAPIMRAR